MPADNEDFASILKEKLLFSIKSLCEIGEELSSTEKFESSSQSILHLMMGTLVISKAAILLNDEGSDEFYLAASRGIEDENFTWQLPSNVINRLHHTHEAIIVDKTEDKVFSDFFASNRSQLEQLHSHIWLPLRVKQRLLGIISISKKFMGQEYTPVDLELLNIIVQQLSIAVNNYYLIKDLKESNFQLNRKILELETLYDLGIAIGSIMEISELAEQIMMNSVSLTDSSAGLLALKTGSGLEIASSINLPGGDVRQLAEYPSLNQVLEDGETIIDNLGAVDTKPFGFNKMLMVPLKGQRGILGLICIADKESRDGYLSYSDEDRRLLQNFATQAGVAIENARFYAESLEKEKLERELQVAATIQQNILPDEPPEIPGLEIAAITIPSRFVGGDHYDFHCRDKEHLLSIADVSGKGIPAALLVSTLHATQLALLEDEWNLPKIVKKISQSVFKSSLSNKFITFFMARYDPGTGDITTVNAGHNHPIVISPDGKMKKLDKGGLVLGLMPQVNYEQQVTRLKPGDLLVMFTDGVNEAMDTEEEEFGDDRLEKLLIDNRDKPAGDIFDIVMKELDDFTEGAPQHDDITLVIVKMKKDYEITG